MPRGCFSLTSAAHEARDLLVVPCSSMRKLVREIVDVTFGHPAGLARTGIRMAPTVLHNDLAIGVLGCAIHHAQPLPFPFANPYLPLWTESIKFDKRLATGTALHRQKVVAVGVQVRDFADVIARHILRR